MGIDQKYLDIIEQCENRSDELTDWERGFVMGEPGNAKRPPLKARPYLSMKQKEILDRIVVERFEGGKWDHKKIRVQYGVINAARTEDGWKITIADYPVGFGVTRKEATILTAWLDSALSAIFAIPPEELGDILDGGQVAEIPEPEEVEDPGEPVFGEDPEEANEEDPF
jgi:hypothetical protein